jgi:hypothetical protein
VLSTLTQRVASSKRTMRTERSEVEVVRILAFREETGFADKIIFLIGVQWEDTSV